MTDEHHGLMNAPLLSGHDFLIDYQNNEIALWKDDAGQSWRGYTHAKLDWARRRSLLSLLFLYTRRDKFVSKCPEQVGIVGIKLPHIETTLPRIAALVAPCPMTFVYCVREPTLVLSSNWEMPWVSTSDDQLFADSVLQQYVNSLAAFRAIKATNIRTIIWKTPSMKGDDSTRNQAFLQELGLDHAMGDYQKNAPPVVDEWPHERRRHATSISDDVIRAFSAAEVVQDFRREFGLPEPL